VKSLVNCLADQFLWVIGSIVLLGVICGYFLGMPWADVSLSMVVIFGVYWLVLALALITRMEQWRPMCS